MHRMTKDAKQREILAKDLFKQLIEGVSTLHSHFIVHQDLSLENLLLHRTQKKQLFIKIIDFGMSRGGPGSQFSKDNWRVEIPSVIGKNSIDHLRCGHLNMTRKPMTYIVWVVVCSQC
eukprot:TRINITY_DN435_c0_g1_i8.p1 TRINITY_DN435_c0_g1~~TRINITY_DN435_c0_g1_i8.p1  ORF type:complete len:118 (-),score=11.45 TRINITY_DN435_c0_g1_i8:671-1024(-)